MVDYLVYEGKLCYMDKADEHLKSEAIESFFRVLHATGDQPPHLLMILRANYNAHPEYDGIIQRLQGMKEKVGEKRKRNDGGKQGEIDAEERPVSDASCDIWDDIRFHDTNITITISLTDQNRSIMHFATLRTSRDDRRRFYVQRHRSTYPPTEPSSSVHI
jgi:hypothetical protein